MTLVRLLKSTVATNNGRARFVLRALLLAIAPSLLVFGTLVALGIETLRTSTDALDPAFMVYSVLLAPVIETAVMLALAAVLARLLPKHAALQIGLVAVVVALAHKIGGDWRQVVNTIWPIVVYATSVVLWLRRSVRDALIVTTIVHALYNITFFAVGILGSLAMGDQYRPAVVSSNAPPHALARDIGTAAIERESEPVVAGKRLSSGDSPAFDAYNSVCSAISSASSASIPRSRTVLSSFLCPSSNWSARRFLVRL